MSGGPPDARPAPLVRHAGPTDSSGGSPASVVAAVAIGMLLFGLVFGFFLGRATDNDGGNENAGRSQTTTTTPTSRPPGDTIPQQPPTSAPAGTTPPSTDLEPNRIGTPEEPIPLGQPYVIGLYELTVNGAEFDAADTLARHDAGNRPPPAGDRRVLVDVTVAYVDSAGLVDTGFLRFDATDGIDFWSDLDADCGNVPDSMLSGTVLGPGESDDGNVCVTVPERRVDPLYLTVEGFDGPVYFALR